MVRCPSYQVIFHRIKLFLFLSARFTFVGRRIYDQTGKVICSRIKMCIVDHVEK